MSTEANKARLRYWFSEMVNGQTPLATLMAALDETFAPDFVDHDGPDPAHGRAALQRVLPGLLRALPDTTLTIEQLVAEGDLVAMRVRGQATHRGEVMGIVPTGKQISWTENELYRFEDGRIVESWGEGTVDEALATIGLAFKGEGG